jgi:hypothetical protein
MFPGRKRGKVVAVRSHHFPVKNREQLQKEKILKDSLAVGQETKQPPLRPQREQALLVQPEEAAKEE